MAALRRFLRWQVGARVLGETVALPFVDDLWLLARPGLHAATGSYYTGLMEADDMAFVLHALRPGDAFHDIGANVGTFSLLAAAAGLDRIHAYEPDARARAWLLRNLQLNGLGPRVAVHGFAVGDRDGEVAFTSGLDVVNHVLDDEAAPGAETLPVRRLDGVADDALPFFLKIDVEGYEPQVLRGCGALLSSPRLLGVLIECNAENGHAGAEADPVRQLTEAGLQPCRYDALRRSLQVLDVLPAARGGNLLLLRSPDQMQARIAMAPEFRLVNRVI